MAGNSEGSSRSIIPGKAGQALDRWGGKLAISFTYTHLSHDLTTGLLAALLPFIKTDLGLNYLQAGFLVSAFSITSGVSQIFGGWVSDRISRRKAMSLGLAGVGLSSAAISLAHSYYSLMAVLVAMGIMAGFYHPSAVATLTDQFEAQRRGRVIALHQLGGGLGFSLGPFFGAIIAAKLNWQFAYLFLGLPALVAAFLVFTRFKLKQPAGQVQKIVSSPATGQKNVGIWQVLKTVGVIISISIALQLIVGPVMSFVSLFLVAVHHLTDAAASMWVTVIRVGGLTGSLFGGWLTDKWGRKKTIFLSFILTGPVVLLLTKLPYGIALGMIFVIFGLVMSMRETTIQTFLMDSAPPNLRAIVFGIYFGFGQQSSSVVQPVAGDLMDSMGIISVFNFIALISVGLSVLAVLLAFKSARQKAANSPENNIE